MRKPTFNKVFIAITCLSLITRVANADNEVYTHLVQHDGQNYWTPERLASVKPQNLPIVDAQTAHRFIAAQQAATPQPGESHPATTPAVEIEPNLQPMFTPVEFENLETDVKDRGRQNANYTSSQLIPETADLAYPYRAAGKLFFSHPDGRASSCTASVIGPRLVITAGHCLHKGSGGNNGYMRNVYFAPAFRNGMIPYGFWKATQMYVPSQWMTSNAKMPNIADYAVFIVEDQVISGIKRRLGDVTGILGYQLNNLNNNHLHLLGYPYTFDSGNKMHQVTAQSFAYDAVSKNVSYGSDMPAGSSGGPWIQNFGNPSVGQSAGTNPGYNKVVGVTSWGIPDASYKYQGASTFDGNLTLLINAACRQGTGNC